MTNIKTIENKRNIQRITVGIGDKYGIAMIAYFKNSLGGQNVERLAVKDTKKVQLYFDQQSESYTLQILDFSIGEVESQYQHFKDKYDVLIKDKISHLTSEVIK